MLRDTVGLHFQLLKKFGLIDLHPTVGFAPAVVGLIGDAELFSHFGYGSALPQQNIGFSQLVNDVLSIVSFLRHGSDLLNGCFTTFDLEQKYQARSHGLRH